MKIKTDIYLDDKPNITKIEKWEKTNLAYGTKEYWEEWIEKFANDNIRNIDIKKDNRGFYLEYERKETSFEIEIENTEQALINLLADSSYCIICYEGELYLAWQGD